MTTFNWTITQMDRLTADGFVVTVHYNVSAQDGDFSTHTYGTISYTKQPGEAYTPYDQLTEAMVVGWVQTSLGKDTVEASLQGQIDALKAPAVVPGLPWDAAPNGADQTAVDQTAQLEQWRAEALQAFAVAGGYPDFDAVLNSSTPSHAALAVMKRDNTDITGLASLVAQGLRPAYTSWDEAQGELAYFDWADLLMFE